MPKIDKCSHCGDNARVNTPWRRPNGEVVCFRCAQHDFPELFSYELLTGLDQLTGVPNGEYLQHGVVLWTGERGTLCWIDNGRTSMPLFDVEKAQADASVPEFMAYMKGRLDKGIWRCTTCKEDQTGAPAGWPLFAGCVCAPCNEKHEHKLEAQRKAGHVCSMCRQPYDNCCC